MDESYHKILGLGIGCEHGYQKILVGRGSYLEDKGIQIIRNNSPYTTAYISYGERYVGFIEIEDTIKDGLMELVHDLKSLGIRKTFMPIGDNDAIAK